MRELFVDKTIIAIAHRLVSIADYDKILVLENGVMKDFDTPFALLVENEKDTKITKKSIFAGLVKNTGKEMAKKIMHKARYAHFALKEKEKEKYQQLQKAQYKHWGDKQPYQHEQVYFAFILFKQSNNVNAYCAYNF